MGWGNFTDADGFALAMTAILVLALGVVLTVLISVLRGSRRRDDEVDRLIEEISDEPEPPHVPNRSEPGTPGKEPWERDGDWWKKRE